MINWKTRDFYTQLSSREIEIQFAACGGSIKFHNFYAPQSGRPPNERIKYDDEMAAHITAQKKHIQNINLEDCNTATQVSTGAEKMKKKYWANISLARPLNMSTKGSTTGLA